MNDYITFKANQYLRTSGSTMNREQSEAWLIFQVRNKTELLKGWMREAIAAGAA